MEHTPTASDTTTPPAVVLRRRLPAACPGSTGWHDRRLDALDALIISDGFRSLIASARAELGRGYSVSHVAIVSMLRCLVLGTKSETSTRWARAGEVCESFDQLTAKTGIGDDQLRRACRLLEHAGVLVELAPSVPPTPKHTLGRPPRRALPWLYDHDHLAALVSGRRVTVEVDQAEVELDPELDLGAPPSTSERGRAGAAPLVDNSTGDGERGRAGAAHPPAPARPSSVSSDSLVQNLQALTRDVAEVEDSQEGDDAGGDPPMSTEWLDQASELSGVTVDELRSEVLDVWHRHGGNLTLLDAGDQRLVEYLSTPAERRRELHTPRINLANRARRVDEPDHPRPVPLR